MTDPTDRVGRRLYKDPNTGEEVVVEIDRPVHVSPRIVSDPPVDPDGVGCPPTHGYWTVAYRVRRDDQIQSFLTDGADSLGALFSALVELAHIVESERLVGLWVFPHMWLRAVGRRHADCPHYGEGPCTAPATATSAGAKRPRKARAKPATPDDKPTGRRNSG